MGRLVSVRRQPSTGVGVVSRSAVEGGEGIAEHWGGRWRLVCCQVRGDQCRGLLDWYKIGCADLNGGSDERGLSCGPDKAGLGTLVCHTPHSNNPHTKLQGNIFICDCAMIEKG